MAFDQKYGRVTVEIEPGNPLGENEPVFILRGRDALAGEAIQKYADICSSAGAAPEHIASVRRVGHNLERWQDENPDLVKEPD